MYYYTEYIKPVIQASGGRAVHSQKLRNIYVSIPEKQVTTTKETGVIFLVFLVFSGILSVIILARSTETVVLSLHGIAFLNGNRS